MVKQESRGKNQEVKSKSQVKKLNSRQKSKSRPQTKELNIFPKFKEVHLQKGEIIEITKDMVIGDVVAAYPQTLEVFKKVGIHCIGCYASTFESIEEGANKHGIDPDKLCKEVNRVLR